MKSNSVCNQTSDLSITRMITDRIGRNKVLLPTNHNHYNFREKIHLGQTSSVGQCVKQKIWKFPSFFRVTGCCYGYRDQFCDWWM